MHDFDPTVSPNNGHMLRNLSKYYLFICCKQSSSTHFCHYLATAFVTDVLAGSNPMKWAQTKTVPLRGPFPIRWWAMRDVRVRLAPPASRFVAPLLACCAGKRFAFPQLRTLAGSNPMRWAQKRKAPIAGSLSNQWWAMRDSNPQPCACKAPALTVAPIARAEREYSKTIASFISYPLKVTGACRRGADSVEIA